MEPVRVTFCHFGTPLRGGVECEVFLTGGEMYISQGGESRFSWEAEPHIVEPNISKESGPNLLKLLMENK